MHKSTVSLPWPWGLILNFNFSYNVRARFSFKDSFRLREYNSSLFRPFTASSAPSSKVEWELEVLAFLLFFFFARSGGILNLVYILRSNIDPMFSNIFPVRSSSLASTSSSSASSEVLSPLTTFWELIFSLFKRTWVFELLELPLRVMRVMWTWEAELTWTRILWRLWICLLLMRHIFMQHCSNKGRSLTRIQYFYKGMLMSKSVLTNLAVVIVLTNAALVSHSNDGRNTTSITDYIYMSDNRVRV